MKRATLPTTPGAEVVLALLACVLCLLAPIDSGAGVSDDESAWALVSPHAFIPAAAEFVWWPLRDISRTLEHLEKAAIVRPGDRAGCQDYFKSTLSPDDRILTACLERATEGGHVLTLTPAGSTVMAMTIETDGDVTPRALAHLDLEGIVAAVETFTFTLSTPTLSIRFKRNDTGATVSVDTETGPRLTYEMSREAERRQWRFDHRPVNAQESTVLLWTAFKRGDEFSMELALRRAAGTATLGKIPFYGAVNRWVLEPLCTVGEQARAALAGAIDWPQELDQLKRDCKGEGIHVGGKRAWFQ